MKSNMAFKPTTYKEALAKLKKKELARKVKICKEGGIPTLGKLLTMTYKSKTMPKRAKITPKLGLKRGSMVKPIPLKMREELSQDLFMKTCCLLSAECKGRIQWHHNLIYAGKRINEYGAILPVCEWHHEKEGKFKRQLNRIMEFRMTREEKDKYPKRKWL